MTEKRIEKAIEVINYAIENNITVTEASTKCGYAYTYVKNVKAVLIDEYKNGTIEDELFSLFMDAYEKYSENKITETKEKDVIDNAPKGLPAEVKGEQTTYRENGNKAEIEWKGNDFNEFFDEYARTGDESYPLNHIKTLDQLMKAADVDLDIWKVSRHTVNKWDVTSFKGDPENGITVQNFQVKANLERVEQLFKYKYAAELFLEMIKGYKPPQLNIIPKVCDKIPPTYKFLEEENNLLEICIFDLHIGKLAWHGETGEDYDVKIASKRFMDALQLLLYRASCFTYNKIIFPVGNDFFNSDTMDNTTTKGTPQDEDLRWQKTFKVGTRLLVDGINLLKQAGLPIEVVVIPGNHDFERSYYMGSYLEAWFNGDSQVTIDNDASPRKYKKFGEVLLGYTHGGEEKEASLPLIMASDIKSKPLWSITKFHEWHLGHIHRKKNMKYTVLDKGNPLVEDLGVTIRYLSSLTGTEEWHHKKGFIGAIKAADAFIWNDKNGLIAHLNSNIII